jgi:hypothetical protein
MTLTLDSVLPNLKTGLENTGFIFGSGTSLEAGYPLMSGLTREVVGGLKGRERAALDEALAAASKAYEDATGTPNIEEISDLVIEHGINSGDARYPALETRIRALVTDVILGVTAPRLDNHIRFLKFLQRRAFGRPVCVYMFTTNYDVLFELAGAQSGVVVETGFVGSVERFFDHQRFAMACGALQSSSRFAEHPVLTVRLVKLHGSISWLARGGRVFERYPGSIGSAETRVMVLPRRRKIMDSLRPPHDQLFSVTSRALGSECKFLATCGFSFGDDHINQDLLLPAVTKGKVRLFALCEQETGGMATMRSLAAFSAGFNTGGISGGSAHGTGTDCWKFSQFVDLFE